MNTTPSLKSANQLFLVVILLMVTLGTLIQAWSTTIGLLITEIFLILAPALLFLRIQRLPLAETIRWRWPGAAPAAFSLLAGLSIGVLAQWYGSFLVQWFGYRLGVTPDFYPTNLGQALILLTGMVVLAPLCEEILFRGVIQRAYEPYGTGRAILWVGLLFALFHLSFLRLFAILPIALVLGWVAWRTHSIASSILVHFAYNLPSTLLIILSSLRPDISQEWTAALPVALLALVAGLLALWRLHHITPAPFPQPEPAPRGSLVARLLPLAAAIVVYLFFAGSELFVNRYPQYLVTRTFTLQPGRWTQEKHLAYELRDRRDQPAGQAACTQRPVSQGFQLECQVHQEAYDVQVGFSRYISAGYDYHFSSLWGSEALALLEAEGDWRNPAGDAYRYQLNGQTLHVEPAGGQPEELALPQGTMLANEWPWKINGLAFTIGLIEQVELAKPQPEPALQEEILIVTGAEPLATPGGNYLAWRVEVGQQSAWYDVNEPHTLLRYDDGQVTYVLTGIQ
ncbi:MAG: type II CAAX endopeptidase family protein [Anaerolineaceae bacterium]|nr:type II CAAX endopeptidase family protein [Anaerolineaceae bacterium]